MNKKFLLFLFLLLAYNLTAQVEKIELENSAIAASIFVSESVVYTAGSYVKGLNQLACYWKNKERIDLESTSMAAGQSITVDGNDVYAAGYYTKGGRQTACYWKNNAKTDLDSTTSSLANCVIVNGKDVYISGWYTKGGKQIACYWKNNEKIDLESTAMRSGAFSIAVNGSDVYVAGWYLKGVFVACYWKNNMMIKLKNTNGIGDSWGSSIVINGSDVYITGHYTISWLKVACWWKNNEQFDLDFYYNSSEIIKTLANSIFVNGSDIYAAGSYSKLAFKILPVIPLQNTFLLMTLNEKIKTIDLMRVPDYKNQSACYWKNNKRIDVVNYMNSKSAFDNAVANSIFVTDSNIYIAGWDNNGYNQKACYWVMPNK